LLSFEAEQTPSGFVHHMLLPPHHLSGSHSA